MDHAANAYLLVLEDLGSLTAGDQVRGVTQAQAQAAVETIGRLHACWWETPALEALNWMPHRNIQPARYHQFWPRRFRGTQKGPMGPYPPTGRTMEADYIAICKVEEGQIVEAWAEWDNLTGLVQLSHYKPPA